MLGTDQKKWLVDSLGQVSARWSVLAQQVPFARIDSDPFEDVESYGGKEMDKWDGYAAERDEIAAAIASSAKERSFNPVVITGDVHANYVWDLKADWDDSSDSSVFGTEFVGTSISSNGDEPLDEDGGFTTQCGNYNGNTHNHFYDNHRGYVLSDVTPEHWESSYRVISSVRDQGATATTLASFVVEAGNPGAQQSDGCPSARP